MLSQIAIEAEAHGDSQTMLRLSIDKHLIAENLTAAQARRKSSIAFPLPRLGRRAGRWSNRAQAHASASRGARSLLGPCPRPPSRSHAARAKRISVLKARQTIAESVLGRTVRRRGFPAAVARRSFGDD